MCNENWRDSTFCGILVLLHKTHPRAVSAAPATGGIDVSPAHILPSARGARQRIRSPGVLSLPQANVLARFSFGVVRAVSCALTTVAESLSFLGSDNTVLQRLKYWLRDGQDKAGPGPTQVQVRSAFPALIGWVLRLWQGVQLALALDATTLHDDLLILAVSVLYRGVAILVAWTFLPANRKQPWMPVILELVDLVAGALPARYEVLLLADRRLYSPRLYQILRHHGWHFLLRVNGQPHVRPQRGAWQAFTAVLPGPGAQWRARGQFSKGQRLACTLLAYWAADQKEAWFLITDLPVQRAQAAWYGLRVWIEEGFRILKSFGWQWRKSRITDPQRGERLWLALVLATVLTLSYGTWAEDQREGPPPPLPESSLPGGEPAETPPEPEGDEGRLEAAWPYLVLTRPRRKSIFRQGLALLKEYVWS